MVLLELVRHFSRGLLQTELMLASFVLLEVSLFKNMWVKELEWFENCFRWHVQRKHALCSLMKLMPLGVHVLMMVWVETMRFSVPCLKLSTSLMALMLVETSKS
ncbi:hypothetical protein Goari_002201 [Gossypium aridum]|uniref:Uncharacterized protein n=1 Tax=Gossypium aridum TaxID=34290 RepID=A0A7J8Y7L6_GOSAI|nr:hypothetical protein [Gossypium aridum]